jgi:hypothetical protein
MDIEAELKALHSACDQSRNELRETVLMMAQHPIMTTTRNPDDWALLLCGGDPTERRRIKFLLGRACGAGMGTRDFVAHIREDGIYMILIPAYVPWEWPAWWPSGALIDWVLARRSERGLGWLVQDLKDGRWQYCPDCENGDDRRRESEPSTSVTDAGKTHIMLDKHDDSKAVSVRRIASTYEGTCNFCDRREPSPEHKLSEIRILPVGNGTRFRVCDNCAPRIVNDLRQVVSGLCLVATPMTPASST